MCGEAVTVVLPSRREGHAPEIAALHRDPQSPVELLVVARPDEQTLRAAGVERAAALALTYRDDQVNVTAALLARTLNPTIRLVVRMYNRERGEHLERLLDRAVLALGRTDDMTLDMSTTVLSDTDTAVPELVAAAAVGRGGTLQVEGQVFRGVVRPARTPPQSADLATLAVLSGAHQDDPASEDSPETPGEEGTQLLPDTVTSYHRQFTHGRLMLEEVTQHHPPEAPPGDRRGYGAWLRDRLAHLPWKVFLSREVLAVFGVLAAIVLALATATALAEPGPLWKSLYLPLLDVFTMGDAATDESPARRVLQLIAGFVGSYLLERVDQGHL
ncbi:NAD-binding protein [Streptomyces sp. NPDC050636]|uniref:NAD-binding protein n=1 Tax=Streptomyces sp. NPDC050636 TaxID=3154510 RepID=UPI003416DEA2